MRASILRELVLRGAAAGVVFEIFAAALLPLNRRGRGRGLVLVDCLVLAGVAVAVLVQAALALPLVLLHLLHHGLVRLGVELQGGHGGADLLYVFRVVAILLQIGFRAAHVHLGRVANLAVVRSVVVGARARRRVRGPFTRLPRAFETHAPLARIG